MAKIDKDRLETIDAMQRNKLINGQNTMLMH